jgi:hypothetical protein
MLCLKKHATQTEARCSVVRVDSVGLAGLAVVPFEASAGAGAEVAEASVAAVDLAHVTLGTNPEPAGGRHVPAVSFIGGRSWVVARRAPLYQRT